MVLTADQWSNKAAFYEKVAEEHSHSSELRAAFARKANWFRILARLAAEGPALGWTLTRPSKETPDGQRARSLTEQQSEALLFSPRRLWAARFAAEAFKRKTTANHYRTTPSGTQLCGHGKHSSAFGRRS